MEETSIKDKIADVLKTVETKSIMAMSISEWRPILAEECQVYVCGENYLAKRFDHINYEFCAKETAEEILKDNLYALLRFKYFTKTSDEVDKRIKDIVTSFLGNIKTSLIKVDFNQDTDCKHVKWLPDGCVAFRNGVYDFINDQWFFKYDKTNIKHLYNHYYQYDNTFIIMWYINIDFTPIGISVANTDLNDFIGIMKELTKTQKNYCFELMYNMGHDINGVFSRDRFRHLCEVMGYLCLQSFSQSFVLLIGSGQNGKNSLFDGCFTSKVIPIPSNIDLDAIEEDRFVTGSLENKSHNIFLETDPEVKTKSKMLKALTGGMYQSIENKGISRYSGIINCKYIWAGNDQDKIKFADNTVGFRRRINIMETWYKWDEHKNYLNEGDYYDVSFSEDLHEIKDDIFNTLIFIYFAMFGIKSGTNDFKKNKFKFTLNDWKMKYTDLDLNIKSQIDSISSNTIYEWISSAAHYEEGKTLFFDKYKKRLYDSDSIRDLGYSTYNDLVRDFFNKEELVNSFFLDNGYCYMSVRSLQKIANCQMKDPMTFTQDIKKIYAIRQLYQIYNNTSYIKVTFQNDRLKIL